jgi:hypothetical protein
MDTLQHSAWGACAGIAAGRTVRETVALAVCGAVPDILGRIGLWFNGDWQWYNQVHHMAVGGVLALLGGVLWVWTGSAMPILMAGVYCLHLALDALTHKPGGGWLPHKEMVVAEVLGWGLILTFLGVWYL